MGLSASEAMEWQFHDALLKCVKKIVQELAITHAEVAKTAATSRTRVTAILKGDLYHVPAPRRTHRGV